MVIHVKYPKVSVVVITFNQDKYISDCLNSILEQEYKNLEIIVSDDGSSDRTPYIVRTYQTQFPELFVTNFNVENVGITPNSNKALALCSGKYVAWMGGDDLMLPTKLQRQVEVMESNPSCHLVYHNLSVFATKTGSELHKFNEKHKHSGGVSKLIKYGSFNGACASMTRMQASPAHGFRSPLLVASDWLYFVDVVGRYGEIIYIDEVLGRYRRHENNVTAKAAFLPQHKLDHFVSCQILFREYPEYWDEIRYRYASLFYSCRGMLPYRDSLLTSIRMKFTLRAFARFLFMLISFGKIQR